MQDTITPGVALALVISLLLLVVGLAAVAYLVVAPGSRGSGNDAGRVDTWHDEAAALAREVQVVVDHSGEAVDPDRVQRRLLPLSERLKGHARTAPDGVDEQLVAALYGLGSDCYRTGMDHTTLDAARTGRFIEDELDDIGTRANQFEMAVPVPSSDDGNGEQADETGPAR